jgi:hypothetical protein
MNFSNSSILSYEIQNSDKVLEEIKQSKLRPIEKQVVQWTPVILGTNFPP